MKISHQALVGSLLLLLGQSCLQFSGISPATAVEVQVQFTLVTDTISSCDTGLTNAGIYAVLEYRLRDGMNGVVLPWIRLNKTSIPPGDCERNFTFTCDISLSALCNTEEANREGDSPLLQFRLVQWEHGGGFCNCWGVKINTWRVQVEGQDYTYEGLTTCDETGTQADLDGGSINACQIDQDNTLSFCSGSASVPRGFLSSVLNLRTGDPEAVKHACPTGQDEVIEPASPVLQECSSSDTNITISFLLEFFDSPQCDAPDSADKGVEFSVGNWNNDGFWFPLAYYHTTLSRREEIRIGEFMEVNDQSFVQIRGYDVPANQVERSINVTLELCDPNIFRREHVQFRWLGTSRHPVSNIPPVDVWALDHVSIRIEAPEGSRTLVPDNFNSLNDSYWNGNVRNGALTEARIINCGDSPTENIEGHFIFFSSIQHSKMRRNREKNIVSRLIRTATLDVGGVALPEPATTPTDVIATCPPLLEPTQTTTPHTEGTTMPPTEGVITPMESTTLVTTEVTTPNQSDITNGTATIERLLDEILDDIKNDSLLRAILEAEPDVALTKLFDLTSNTSGLEQREPVVLVFLLASILERELSTLPPTPPGLPPPPPNVTAEIDQFSRNFIKVLDNVISGNQEPVEVADNEERREVAILGSTLLSIAEDFALMRFSADSGDFAAGTITLQASRVDVDMDGDDGLTFVPRPEYSLRVPRELLRMFRNQSANERGQARMVSHLFENMTGVIPGDTATRPGTELVSSVISMGLQCDSVMCETGEVELSEPVVLTISHSVEVQERLMDQDSNTTTLCMFWEFRGSSDGLSFGEWSNRGCSKNEALSNVSTTVCECYHLTHFAILLSSAPLELPPSVTLSLEIIGAVGVAVSLLAMGITVFIFLFQKSLRNTRNFIHINLCVSLGIAQIIFVAAVDRASGSDDDVPAHCQAVAVLLHYFFLVTFMWMLMEGVILYLTLVKVFVKHKKRYMLAFALTSYGVPLLYLGALTLPLGFALDTQPNYGYASACYLNPENGFIWAFIAPVIAIILINFGFFIMAATIIWRHQRKQTSEKKTIQVKNWLKASLSLVVIMGLTWILGVLIVEVNALLPLAYIYTIMVAFQGLWIFIIFVLMSKQVREVYAKWWRAKVNESDILSKYFGEKMPSTVITNKSNTKHIESSTGGGTLPPPLSLAPPESSRPDEEDFTPGDLPVVPITPTSLGDRTPPPTSVPAIKHTHWGTVRDKVHQGNFFHVVCSPSYFEPSDDTNTP